MLENMNKILIDHNETLISENFIFDASLGFVEYDKQTNYSINDYKNIADNYMYIDKSNKHIKNGIFDRNKKVFLNGLNDIIIKESDYDLMPYFNNKNKYNSDLKKIKNIKNDLILLSLKKEELKDIDKKYNYSNVITDLKENNKDLFNTYVDGYKDLFYNDDNKQNQYILIDHKYDSAFKFFEIQNKLQIILHNMIQKDQIEKIDYHEVDINDNFKDNIYYEKNSNKIPNKYYEIIKKNINKETFYGIAYIEEDSFKDILENKVLNDNAEGLNNLKMTIETQNFSSAINELKTLDLENKNYKLIDIFYKIKEDM